jgi:6-phosphogluconolactonase
MEAKRMFRSTVILCIIIGNLSSADEARFYLGATENGETSISVWGVDLDTGAVSTKGIRHPIVNPSYMCVSSDRRFLYSVSERSNFQGRKDGSLSSFRINEQDGSLTLLNTVSSQGAGPAHVSLDRTGRFLLSANYGAGSVAVHPIEKNGSLGTPTASVQHSGSSVNERRQKAPHPHSIVTGPKNKTVYVPDLGLDRLKAYRFDDKTGSLTAAPEKDVVTPPGSGPRHITFHPGGKFAYVTLELTSQLAAYAYDNGSLNEIGIVDMLPPDFDGNSTSAEVRVAPDGRFVYASNRGHDSIAVFRINTQSGTLTPVQQAKTLGKTPRNFALDPSGRILVVQNQLTENLVTFHINKETGKLAPTGHQANVGKPGMICFF